MNVLLAARGARLQKLSPADEAKAGIAASTGKGGQLRPRSRVSYGVALP